MKFVKRLIFIALLALLGLVLAGILGEILVRLFVPSGSVARWFVLDEKYGYVQRPNYHQVWHYAETDVTWRVDLNSMGLRDREYDLGRRDVRRVILLGDSFTFGYGLDADLLFDERLERLLNRGTNRWYVINCGVGGWGTLQEVTWALDHLELFKPDVIVLTYCRNDQHDDSVFREGAADGLLPRFPGKRFLRDYSRLYGVIYGGVHAFLFRRVVRADEGRVAETHGVTKGEEPPPESDPALREAMWADTLKYIRRLRDGFLKYNPHGVILIQTTHPWEEEIRRHLMEVCDGCRVVYVDLEPEVEKLGRGRVFLPYDPHWTAEMHDVSARCLYEALGRWQRRCAHWEGAGKKVEAQAPR